MTLNHSKTWPVSTFAVVQLRVDSEGHIYSAISKENGRVEESGEPSAMVQDKPPTQASHPMLPSREHHQEQPNQTIQSYKPPEEPTAPNDPLRPADDRTEANGNVGIPTKKQTPVLPLSRKHLEMFAKISPPPPQYRATVRTDTVSTILDQEFDYDQEEGRRPSIRVDNWDYIYTERVSPENVAPGRLRCPIHRYGPEPPHRRDSDEPELPLDARKSATLKKHYYLEGGWGWVIVVCSVMVNVLNHGVQLSTGQLTREGAEKFKVEPVVFAGFEEQ